MADQPLVLVTGASGFIALHCIVQLLEAGYRVPTLRMTDWLFRAAALFDPTLRLVMKSLGK